MRATHWKAHLLPLLLLSLHSVSVCLAATCSFDEFVVHIDEKNIPTAKDQPKGQDWEPLRIVVSAKDLEGPPKYCVKQNDDSVYEISTKVTEPECNASFGIIPAGKVKSAMSILEKAITLHTDRLLVQRVVGPLKIPDFSPHPICKYFNVPKEHRTTGVANADMVLYAAYDRGLNDNDDTESLGLTCAKSEGGRPIAGGLMFGSNDVHINRHSVRFTTHHIAHVLGFSYSEMKSRNMIMDKKVRGKPNPVAVVNSEKTKEMTRAHYGCSTADGMEMEDGEKNDQKLSHWERRNAKDELMSEPIRETGTSFMGFYTNLTLAAFEDMGYYKANSLAYCLPHRGAKVQYPCCGEAKNSIIIFFWRGCGSL